MKKYKAISCVFYDFIEHYATLGKSVKIVIAEQGKKEAFQSKILNTKTEGGIEYMLVEGKRWIQLDHIISIEDHNLSDYHEC